MKRLYEVADASEVEGGHGVALDGRPVRTPAGHTLKVPTAALGSAIAAEWAAQGEVVQPATMRLMALACTAIDHVTDRHADVVAAVAAFAETDLLCHRATEPADLVERQIETWQPLLDWCAETYDAALGVTEGVLPVAQDAAAIEHLRDAAAACDAWRLTALHAATAACGSLVLGLALVAGRVGPDDAAAAAELDDAYQRSRWGEDAEAGHAAAEVRADIAAAWQFLRLLEGETVAARAQASA